MTKREFRSGLHEVVTALQEECKGKFTEPVCDWMGKKMPNVFVYAATSEHCMEHQLRELKGEERKTTFMSDLSIGEWVSGVNGVIDTIKRAVSEWCDDEEFMAEFILCLNWKAWEHHARGNSMWAVFYSSAYERIVDLIYDYYDGDKEKTSYLWRYLD